MRQGKRESGEGETGEEGEGKGCKGGELQAGRGEVTYSGGMLSPCSLSCFFAAFSNSII